MVANDRQTSELLGARVGLSRALAAVVVVLVGLVAAGCENLLPKRSKGEQIYRARCAECHGFDGRGNTPRYMGNPNADLTRSNYTDVSTMEGVIREGVPGQMRGNPDLTRTEMRALLDWIRHLRGEGR